MLNGFSDNQVYISSSIPQYPEPINSSDDGTTLTDMHDASCEDSAMLRSGFIPIEVSAQSVTINPFKLWPN